MPANTPTARDILLDVVRFHGDLASHYQFLTQSLADVVDSRDSRLLLQYLQRHERVLQGAVQRCGTELRDDVLATPLSTETVLPSAQELPPLPNQNVEAIVEFGSQMDRALISYFEELADSAPNEPLRRLFCNLRSQETQEENRLHTASLCLQHV